MLVELQFTHALCLWLQIRIFQKGYEKDPAIVAKKQFRKLPRTVCRVLIDGILLIKFDNINDKVGVALLMVYISGAPMMFVGCGQFYTNLIKLNGDWLRTRASPPFSNTMTVGNRILWLSVMLLMLVASWMKVVNTIVKAPQSKRKPLKISSFKGNIQNDESGA
ncbi:unnamed protein product [Lactuca virosa]|uniref:SRP54-type proteins GTP-binding domain-containing protein n=1 Tax=Lactuca virosa TaxID=75947 RepID=A0AAU9LTU1_9ASTR|nr:unnamed protein product [Lactuca virosa]